MKHCVWQKLAIVWFSSSSKYHLCSIFLRKVSHHGEDSSCCTCLWAQCPWETPKGSLRDTWETHERHLRDFLSSCRSLKVISGHLSNTKTFLSFHDTLSFFFSFFLLGFIKHLYKICTQSSSAASEYSCKNKRINKWNEVKSNQHILNLLPPPLLFNLF